MKAKLITLLIVTAISFSASTQAQVIQNFENGLPAGVTAPSDGWENPTPAFPDGTPEHPECYSVEANPSIGGLNTSANCMKLTHKGYTHWGSKNNFGINIDLKKDILVDNTSDMRYFHFKYYTATAGAKVGIMLSDGINNINTAIYDVATLTSQWVDVVFDMNTPSFFITDLTGIYLIPDYQYATNNRTTDVVVYMDDIQITNSALAPTALHRVSKPLFSIYPNPATDIVTILGAADSKASIYNSVGQKVLQNDITESKQSINVGNMSKGVYVLKVTHRDG